MSQLRRPGKVLLSLLIGRTARVGVGILLFFLWIKYERKTTIRLRRLAGLFFIQRESAKWDFCKTAEKPYDALVVGCLKICRAVAPECFSLSSDGSFRITYSPGLLFLFL